MATPRPTRLYLRVIDEDGRPVDDDESELERLRTCLVGAEGVVRLLKLEPHPRGGYAVTVECSGAVDSLLDELKAAGYRLVI
jgi:hypothetical protein